MAEIKVEPKRGGMGWLWAIIVIALLAVAAWYFFSNTGTAPAAPTPDSARTSMIQVPTISVGEGGSNG
jgi:hypothetical protein